MNAHTKEWITNGLHAFFTYNSSKPHAVETVGSVAHPVLSQAMGCGFTYNGFGKVTHLHDGMLLSAINYYDLDITYGPDRERWKSVETGMFPGSGGGIAPHVISPVANITRTNLYAGDYERIDGTSYYYLDGGIIYVKPATGAGQAYYALTDHLGCYVRLYTMAGDSVLIASYDPWGNRTTTKNTLKFFDERSDRGRYHRGFTGHEHLTTYGVINMRSAQRDALLAKNARLYDPFTGTFISPDPYIQSPDNSQSFNRYSYCLNNPLKYVDRDGKVFWLVPVLVGAAIGAGISGTTYAVTAMINKSWNPHAFTKALGMGAFSGALGGAIGLVGSSLGPSVASGANKFAFNLLSQTTNSIATNAVFGGDLSFKSILGITAGAALGSVLPNFKAMKGGALVNGLAETGYNTARGAVTGFGQGLVNAALCKDADYIWQNTAGGAISGFSRSLFMNAIFGAQYDSSAKGYYRQGGLAELVLKAYQFMNYGNFDIKGYGLTLGRHMFIPTGDEKTMMHESMHIEQQDYYGWATFYALELYQYAKYGFYGTYQHKGSLEWNAEHGIGM